MRSTRLLLMSLLKHRLVLNSRIQQLKSWNYQQLQLARTQWSLKDGRSLKMTKSAVRREAEIKRHLSSFNTQINELVKRCNPSKSNKFNASSSCRPASKSFHFRIKNSKKPWRRCPSWKNNPHLSSLRRIGEAKRSATPQEQSPSLRKCTNRTHVKRVSFPTSIINSEVPPS